MSDENFDIKNMFNEPNFNVNPQKYIVRLRDLLGKADKYIKSLEVQVKDKSGMDQIMYMGQIIFCEYQKGVLYQMINSLEFYSK